MNSLDWQPKVFRDALYRAADWVTSLYEDLHLRPAAHGTNPAALHQQIDEAVPKKPIDPNEILRRFERDIAPAQSLNISPRFFGYVLSGGNQAAILASLLAAGLNTCGGKWQVSASHAELERVAIRWICEFIGLDNKRGGMLTSGGSKANLLALHVARVTILPFDVRKQGLSKTPPLTVYASVDSHSSIQKCIEMLGIGDDQLRRVAVRDDFSMDPDNLVRLIDEDRSTGCRPFCVVATAGTTNTGAIDPLVEISAVCRKYGLWFHVDGAYGVPAASTPSAGHLFAGLELADSITVDPHKWLYVPFEAGCLLVRTYKQLQHAFSLVPNYLADDNIHGNACWDWHEFSFQLSRDFKALKVWMTFLAYGTHALTAAIDKNIRTMQYLAQLIDESPDFERLAPVPLSIVCFRYLGVDKSLRGDEESLNRLNNLLLDRVILDGRVFLAGTRISGKRALRACCVNHRSTFRDVEELLRLLRQLGTDSALELTMTGDKIERPTFVGSCRIKRRGKMASDE